MQMFPQYVATSVNVTDTEALTDSIDYRSARGGSVYVPPASAVTELTWYSAPLPSAVHQPALDRDGLPIVQPVAADRAVPIPDALFGCGSLKPVGDATGVVIVSVKG